PAGGRDGLVADGGAVEPDELLSSADAVRLLARTPPATAPAASSPAALSSLLLRRDLPVGWFSCIVSSFSLPPSDDGRRDDAVSRSSRFPLCHGLPVIPTVAS